ncbi:MAG: hypothetical protein ACOCRK_00630 [bacterium]
MNQFDSYDLGLLHVDSSIKEILDNTISDNKKSTEVYREIMSHIQFLKNKLMNLYKENMKLKGIEIETKDINNLDENTIKLLKVQKNNNYIDYDLLNKTEYLHKEESEC